MSESPEKDDHEQKDLMSPAQTVTTLSRRYSDWYALRAAVQAIPGLGGALDTMLAGLGTQWQMKRFEAFIDSLDRRLSAIEPRVRVNELEPSEPLYDFVMEAIEKTIRTNSAKKREAFAAVVTRQVINHGTWDEAESALQLIGGLSELQIEMLRLAMDTEVCSSPFKGHRVVTFRHLKDGPMALLPEHFGDTPLKALHLACADLVAKGLLEDIGVGKLSTSPMTHFAITEGAQWLLDWIRE